MPLAAQGIHASYLTHHPVLRGVDVAIEPGRTCVVVGPNGAGKSTLLRVLAGVRRPDAGTVLLDGTPIRSIRARARARRLAMVVQEPAVSFGYSARRVIAFGAEGAGRPQSLVDDAIERFGLQAAAGMPFDQLSVGQRQRVALARAFVQLDAGRAGPDRYLLADEPVSAMDPRHAADCLGELRAMTRRGVGVVMVLHDLSQAAAVGDHAILLSETGAIAGHGSGDEVLTAERLGGLFATPIVRAEVPGIGPVLASPPIGSVSTRPASEHNLSATDDAGRYHRPR